MLMIIKSGSSGSLETATSLARELAASTNFINSANIFSTYLLTELKVRGLSTLNKILVQKSAIEMLKVEVSQGVFVSCSFSKEEGNGFTLQCSLRRQGHLGLKIYEKIHKKEEIEELINRPRWLGKNSDRALRRGLSLLLEKIKDAESP